MKFSWIYPIILGAVTLTACEQEGPAERAGKKVDRAVDNARDHLDEATEDLDDRYDENERRNRRDR